jgi:hypothetical protein
MAKQPSRARKAGQILLSGALWFVVEWRLTQHAHDKRGHGTRQLPASLSPPTRFPQGFAPLVLSPGSGRFGRRSGKADR